MTYVLIYSVNDPAGRGVAKYLREVLSCRELSIEGVEECFLIKELNAILAGFKEETIYLSSVDSVFPNASTYVFLSKHSASSGIKSLTAHHTGNPTSSNEMGGEPFKLSISNPPLTFEFIKGLKERYISKGLSDFKVVYEVTHHGPTSLTRPLSFIEIGSTINEWGLRRAHELLGEVVIESIKSLSSVNCIPSVGVGGPHYAEKLTERALKFNECYGHIISRHAIKELRRNPVRFKLILKQAISKSSARTERIVMFKKVGAVIRGAVKEVADSLGIELVVI